VDKAQIVCSENATPSIGGEATMIDEEWMDDYAMDTQGFGGWSVRRDRDGDTVEVHGLTFAGSEGVYHGPFSGSDYNPDSTDNYYLTQSFYCRVDSQVSVRYKYVYCGTEKQHDHIWLSVNGEWLDQTDGRPSGRHNLEDELLSEAFGTQCPGGWKYNEMGRFTFDVLRRELFTVELNLAMNYANDHMAVTDLAIACAQRGLTEYSGVILNDLNNLGGRDARDGDAAGTISGTDQVTVSLRPEILITFWVVAVALSMNICWAYWCGYMAATREHDPHEIAMADEGSGTNGSFSEEREERKRYGVRHPVPSMSGKDIVAQPPQAVLSVDL